MTEAPSKPVRRPQSSSLTEKRSLLLKGGAVSVALAVSAVAYLVAYALLARSAGLAVIGLWGLIAAFFQYGRTIDLGAGASILGAVPGMLARGERREAADHVDQAFILSGLVGMVAAAAVGAGLYFYTRSIMSTGQIADFRVDAVLAINAVSLVLMSQGSTLHAGIDAHGRAELRSLIVLIGSLIFAVLAVPLAATFSILGLAIAQLAQWLAMWLVSRALLYRLNPDVRLWPRTPNVAAMRSIARGGWRFQSAALIAAALDPVAKAMAVAFGGLPFAGTFEILLRIVGGGRTIFANGFQVLAPAIARLGGEQQREVFLAGFGLALRIAVLFGVIFLAWTPLVASLVTGTASGPLLPAALFVVAWAINLLSGPSYFAAIGLGLGNLNLRAHLIMALGLGLLGPALGFAAGGTGVIAAYAAAVVGGSLYSALAVNSLYGAAVREIAGQFRPVEVIVIALAVATSVASALLSPTVAGIVLGAGASFLIVLAALGRYAREGWRAFRQVRS